MQTTSLGPTNRFERRVAARAEERLRVLLLPLGSHGDVLPFLAIGRALAARGHDVTLGANEHFAEAARRARIPLLSTGRAEEYVRESQDPELWHPTRGTPRFLELALRWGLRPHFDAVRSWHAQPRSVVLASSFSLGARVAHDAIGVPLVTVHLQPHLIASRSDPPIGPGLPEWAPRSFRHLVHRLLLRFLFDPPLARRLDDLHDELGLPRVARIAGAYWNSPQRIVGLYPSWFADRQRDWPAHATVTGFPLYDDDDGAMSAELERYLAAGTAPIVFTPGSAMRDARAFFREAAEACRILGRRGLLLTRFGEQVPSELPEGVRHFEYVPFGRLLPHAAALVHHGGIGTFAQAARAGIPQIISPTAHDQFDNAARARRLGVARVIARKHFVGPRLARELGDMLSSASMRERCGALSLEMRRTDPSIETAEIVERAV